MKRKEKVGDGDVGRMSSKRCNLKKFFGGRRDRKGNGHSFKNWRR